MLGGITVNKSEEDAKRLVSIPALLRRNAANFGSLAAFREKEFGIWQTWSWSKALDEAENFGLGLIELGTHQTTHQQEPLVPPQ